MATNLDPSEEMGEVERWMPLLLLILALIALLVLIAVTLPLSIISRYRAGTARRRARSWLALVNVFSIGFSVVLFFVGAAVSSFWVHGAFSYSAGGFAGGLALGIVGLRLTRWEAIPQSLHYTPNPWLVLAITISVSFRLAFGFWRAWQAWHAAPAGHSWLAEAGLAGSMATGAVVLGYYLCFWSGVWMRVRQAVARPS